MSTTRLVEDLARYLDAPSVPDTDEERFNQGQFNKALARRFVELHSELVRNPPPMLGDVHPTNINELLCHLDEPGLAVCLERWVRRQLNDWPPLPSIRCEAAELCGPQLSSETQEAARKVFASHFRMDVGTLGRDEPELSLELPVGADLLDRVVTVTNDQRLPEALRTVLEAGLEALGAPQTPQSASNAGQALRRWRWGKGWTRRQAARFFRTYPESWQAWEVGTSVPGYARSQLVAAMGHDPWDQT